MKRIGILSIVFLTCAVSHASPQTIGEIATNIAGSFEDIGKLMIGVAYISGIGFGIASVFKFKQVKDNPTQIPIGTPFALLFISAMLVFLPGLYMPVAETIFGKPASELSGEAGGFEGEGVCGLPGEQPC